MTVQVRVVGDQRVLTITGSVRVGQIDDHIASCAERLSSLTPGVGNVFAVFHGEITTHEAHPVEVCLPVGEDDPVRVPVGVADRVEPAHREAWLPVTKAGLDHPEILDSYDRLDDFLRDNGWTLTAAPREIYVADFASTTMDDVVCELAFPFTH